MFENDRAAEKGKMAVRALVVFRHDCELGNAPAHRLFELVAAEKGSGVAAPRAYSDYLDIQEATDSHTYERAAKPRKKWMQLERP